MSRTRDHSWFRPLAGDPRFEALLREMDAELAEMARRGDERVVELGRD